MAVTQYIGARYVQVFADPAEWSSAKEYEPLTVVLHEGNSFTSKQFVPVGIDINNEKYWAETGNFNAQVEAYRREVQDAIENVHQAIDDINLLQNEIKLISPYLQGTSVYIEHENNKILLDCGDTTDNARMENFLISQNVDKLDCVVITHFDHDHSGAFPVVARYCDASTDIFIQMEPLAGTANETTYNNGLSTINSYVNQYGLKTPRTPYEGEHVAYGEIDIEFHNTTLSNRSLYENTPGEGYAWNSGKVGLNNYSLISIVDINDYVITYSGDIEAVAQRLNAQYMRKSALSFTPHHISGVGGYLPWWTAQSPQQWLGTSAASTFGTKLRVNNRYIVKMIRYNYISDVILTHNDSLEIEIYNNAYNIIKGESLIATIAEEDLDSCYTVLYQILPPGYVSDNPFVLYTMTIKQLVSACTGAEYGIYTATTSLTDRNEMQIFKDIRALMNNSSAIDTRTFSIETGRFLRVAIHSADTLYDELTIYGSVDVEAKTGYRLISTGNSFRAVFDDNPIVGTGDLSTVLTQVQLSMLLRSKHAYVITSGGLIIWLNRIQTASASTQSMGAQGFVGYAFNTAMTTIYRIGINDNGAIFAKSRTFDDATLKDATIVSCGVM